jgi:hypothetical protein
VDQPTEVLGTRIGKESGLLKVGVIAETVNLIALGVLNFAGPALLETVRFGSYARSFGVAFLALGIVDSPMALALLVKHTGANVRRAMVRKTGLSLCLALPIGALTLGSGQALISSLCLCLVHSLGSSAISLAYRNARAGLVVYWYVSVLTVMLGSMFAGSQFGWTAPTIILVQSVVLFFIGAGLIIPLVRFTRRASFQERPVLTPALGVPTYITGPLQWVLVLIAGAAYGSAQAATVKVGSAFMNLPLAAIPLSGQLLLAHTHQTSQESATGVRSRIVLVAGAGILISIAVFIFRDFIFEILDLRGGTDTKKLLPFLLAGGVGLAVFSTSWPSTSSELLNRAQARAGLMAFAVAALIVIGGMFAGPGVSLIALTCLYIVAGFVAYLLTFMKRGDDVAPRRRLIDQ